MNASSTLFSEVSIGNKRYAFANRNGTITSIHRIFTRPILCGGKWSDDWSDYRSIKPGSLIFREVERQIKAVLETQAAYALYQQEQTK